MMKPGLTYTESNFFIRLLPFLEEQSLYDKWDFKTPATNVTLERGHVPRCYQNPCADLPLRPLRSQSIHAPRPRIREPIAQPRPALSVGCVLRAPATPATTAKARTTRSSRSSRSIPTARCSSLARDHSCKQASSTRCVENHYSLSPASVKSITDGTSKTLLMGEKYHYDQFFDTWTSGNSGMRMYQVSAWGWVGGMKGAAHIFCSSAVGINESTRVYTSRRQTTLLHKIKRYNGWGSGHPGVCCFVFADGSTRILSETINRTALTAITTRAGAETIDSPD